ncbi:DUF6122 family protein [Aliikangiella sp. G2MR2-5]|uniref:DUF6122 family protein n=1 Tax=Aliikangiella sp. G2MR2-5 TaxID=2788943 RepID=UPI00352FD04A
MLHILLHFVLPALISPLFGKKRWLRNWLILCATMLVDLDHLLATPIYDPLRCSINFHPLHTYWAIGVYIVFLGFRPTRIVATGLIIHMLLDWQDCYYKITFTMIFNSLIMF